MSEAFFQQQRIDLAHSAIADETAAARPGKSSRKAVNMPRSGAETVVLSKKPSRYEIAAALRGTIKLTLSLFYLRPYVDRASTIPLSRERQDFDGGFHGMPSGSQTSLR